MILARALVCLALLCLMTVLCYGGICYCNQIYAHPQPAFCDPSVDFVVKLMVTAADYIYLTDSQLNLLKILYTVNISMIYKSSDIFESANKTVLESESFSSGCGVAEDLSTGVEYVVMGWVNGNRMHTSFCYYVKRFRDLSGHQIRYFTEAYQQNCGCQAMDMDEVSRYCKFYFDFGVPYAQILALLSENHSIIISMSSLKRILRKKQLCRRKKHADILEVAVFIEDTIRKTGCQQGYRSMHLRCRQNELNIPRDTVQILMQLIDPIGTQLRLSRRLKRRQYHARGPNFLWHLDSYDKLKRYGLCINGCIDGFSRCILWLNVFHTSSDPKVVAGYYIETVIEKGGCPHLIRGDRGTENAHVAKMQDFLTGRKSFLYGRSTSNQRIEMFWNYVRKLCGQAWMDSLGTLTDEGWFDGYMLDKCLIQFCCLRLLQVDLDKVVKVWNAHQIRPTKNQNCPHGRPLVMYSVPALYNTQSHLQSVSNQDITTCAEACVFRNDTICDEDVAELCRSYMNENGWLYPTDLAEGIELYKNLRVAITHELNTV